MAAEEAWQRLAVHEAGHATVAVLVGAQVRETMVDRDLGKGFTVTRGGDPWIEAVIYMAGLAADRLTGRQRSWWDAQHDVIAARGLVGWDRVHEALDEAEAIIDRHWPAVDAVARAIYYEDAITGDRVLEIVRGHTPRTHRQVTP